MPSTFGRSVAEDIASEVLGLCTALLATFTAGERLTEQRIDGRKELHVPPPYMAGRLAGLAEQGCLRLPRRWRRRLEGEFQAYQQRVTTSATGQVGLRVGARAGAHDDVIAAIGLASI